MCSIYLIFFKALGFCGIRKEKQSEAAAEMVQGRGNAVVAWNVAGRLMLLAVVAVALVQYAQGAITHVVGGTGEWTLPGSSNTVNSSYLSDWVSTQTFVLGDSLCKWASKFSSKNPFDSDEAATHTECTYIVQCSIPMLAICKSRFGGWRLAFRNSLLNSRTVWAFVFCLSIKSTSRNFHSVFGAHLKKLRFTRLHQRDLMLFLRRNILF